MRLVIIMDKKRYDVEVDGTDKAKTLKTKIFDKSGAPPYMLTLVSAGQELNDEQSFEQQGVAKEGTIHVTRTLTLGTNLELTVCSKINPALKTFIRIEEGKKIIDLKQKIYEEFKCRPEKQLLYTTNTREPEKEIYLEDSKGVWEYEFDHTYTIFVYYDFEGTLLFTHKSGYGYKMKIKSNSLITQIKDQLRNEHGLSVTEIYNESNVKLDNGTTIAANRVSPTDVLRFELLDDLPKRGINPTHRPHEHHQHPGDQMYPPQPQEIPLNYSHYQTQPPKIIQRQNPPKPHQTPQIPQNFQHPRDPNYPQNYQHKQHPRDPNYPHDQQHWDRNIHHPHEFQPQGEHNVNPTMHPNTQHIHHPEPNYPPRAMAPNYPQPQQPREIPFDKRVEFTQSDRPHRHLEKDRSLEGKGYGRDQDRRTSQINLRKAYPESRTPFHHPDQEDWYGEKGFGFNPTPEEPVYVSRAHVNPVKPTSPPTQEQHGFGFNPTPEKPVYVNREVKPTPAPTQEPYDMGDRFLSQVITAAENEWERIGTFLLNDFSPIRQIKSEQNNEPFASSMCVLKEWKQRWQTYGARSGVLPYTSSSLASALESVGRQDLVQKYFPRK